MTERDRGLRGPVPPKAAGDRRSDDGQRRPDRSLHRSSVFRPLSSGLLPPASILCSRREVISVPAAEPALSEVERVALRNLRNLRTVSVAPLRSVVPLWEPRRNTDERGFDSKSSIERAGFNSGPAAGDGRLERRQRRLLNAQRATQPARRLSDVSRLTSIPIVFLTPWLYNGAVNVERRECKSGRIGMSLWIFVVALLVASVVVAVVGFQRNSGVLMVASGAWALFFVGCGFVVGLDDEFVLFVLPLIGAFGLTVLVLGLKALFK